jgi:hypothetical protein
LVLSLHTYLNLSKKERKKERKKMDDRLPIEKARSMIYDTTDDKKVMILAVRYKKSYYF